MKVFTEKRALEFLRKKGFDIIETIFIKKEKELDKIDIAFPYAMKVSGDKIVHKTIIGGVKLNIMSKIQALNAFKELMKIKDAQGVLVQRQIFGKKEYFLGLKKTPEFGYVIAFGEGGVNVEKKAKVDFRVCGAEGVKDILNPYGLSKEKNVLKIIDNLCGFSAYGIESLDINPLVIEKGKLIVVDSQIVFE